MEANDSIAATKTETEDGRYLWQVVTEPDGRKSFIVFEKPKHYLAGWVMQHEDGTWVARTDRGVRGEFETDEDAKAFLRLLLASNG